MEHFARKYRSGHRPHDWPSGEHHAYLARIRSHRACGSGIGDGSSRVARLEHLRLARLFLTTPSIGRPQRSTAPLAGVAITHPALLKRCRMRRSGDSPGWAVPPPAMPPAEPVRPAKPDRRVGPIRTVERVVPVERPVERIRPVEWPVERVGPVERPIKCDR